jgi:hypothetical protein
MRSAYGVDTLAPGLSLRRFWVLWNRLPPSTRVRADAEESWSQEAHLLAAVVDSVGHLDYVTRQLWSKSNVEMPERVERPGGDRPAVKQGGTSPWRNLLRKLGGGEVRPRGR